VVLMPIAGRTNGVFGNERINIFFANDVFYPVCHCQQANESPQDRQSNEIIKPPGRAHIASR
jgi:hypothetical protein